MKSAIRTATAVLAIGTLTTGVASAMVLQDDLRKNRFPDQGISIKVVSDIDTGFITFRDDVSGLGELEDGKEPLTRYPQQL